MLKATHVVQLWCSLALMLAPVVTSAAPAEITPESPRFTRLSVEHGLSQSSVLQILQDRRGLLWFGTQEGLNRYDGYRFTVHRAGDRDGFLRDHEINALTEDAPGEPVGRDLARPLSLRPRHGTFRCGSGAVDALGILKLARSGDGRIFFASSDGRLWTLDPADPDRRARSLSDGAFGR